MFGRLYMIPAGPEARKQMEAVADHFAPLYRDLPGFKSVTFFQDEQGTVYGSFSLWESREAAEAATDLMAGELTMTMEQVPITDYPKRLLLEIYEPKS